ncbi:hypothetical protein COPEUT_01320 [Coprococcus eutactus ATCC 27759]|nr:hypothetical protein COPEUT_01320 [Coprococcus eutactus ATCC 27759]
MKINKNSDKLKLWVFMYGEPAMGEEVYAQNKERHYL